MESDNDAHSLGGDKKITKINRERTCIEKEERKRKNISDG
jgi:hypothetical protein